MGKNKGKSKCKRKSKSERKQKIKKKKQEQDKEDKEEHLQQAKTLWCKATGSQSTNLLGSKRTGEEEKNYEQKLEEERRAKAKVKVKGSRR